MSPVDTFTGGPLRGNFPGPTAHYARRYYSAAWGPAAAATWYAISLDTNDGGDTSVWDGSLGYVTYKCPFAGSYHFVASWTVTTPSSPTAFGVGFGRPALGAIGGAALERRVFSNNPLGTLSCTQCSGTLACSANDLIALQVGGSNGTPSKSSASPFQDCYFEGWRVG